MIAAGAYDGLSARMVEVSGFDAIWLSGFCVSCSSGIPDTNILTADELVSRAQQIRLTTNLPLIVDCDEGYGSDPTCAHLARRLSLLGVWGACIEDNVFPKRNSFDNRQRAELLPVDTYCQRLRAAKAAAPGLRLIARTETLVRGGTLSEAVDRCLAAMDSGADYCVIHCSYKTLEEYQELAKVGKRWGIPLVTIPTKADDVSLDDIANLGFQIVVAANQSMRAATAAMIDVLSQLKSGNSIGKIDRSILPMEFFFEQFS